MKEKKVWFLYIILTKKNKLYTGITTDLKRRFLEHKTKKGAKFFRSDTPKKIVYQKKYKDRSSASKAEAQMKKLSRERKLEIIYS